MSAIIGALRGVLSLDSAAFDRGVDRSGRKMRGLKNDFGALGRSARGLGASIKLGITAPMAAAAGSALGLSAAIKTISGFDREMSKLAAISRASAAELSGLKEIAENLGATTEFSSQQAAAGLTFLAQAGFSASDAMAAIPDVLNLATASSLDLARAADIASNIMSGFGVEADRAAEVSDILAATASRANTDVSQLGEAMKFVGPVAASLEISMSEAAAAIGVLSDAGIQGGMAGTSLRGIISRLVKPVGQAQAAIKEMGLTLEQVSPATNSLADIIDLLADRSLTARDAFRIFGQESAPALLALVSQNRRLRDLGDELTTVGGAASEMAATMRDNLQGDFDTLKSSMAAMALALGEAGLTASLRAAIAGLTDFVRWVTEAITAVGRLLKSFGEWTGGVSAAELINRQMTLALDNTSIAMGDQQRAIANLAAATRDGQFATMQSVRAKLQEARAIREAILAQQDQMRLRVLEASGYDSLIAKIEQVRGALFALRAPGDDLEQMPAKMRDGYAALEEELASLLVRQKDMLAAAAEANGLTDDQAKALSDIEQVIARLSRRMEEFAGVQTVATQLSERLGGVLSLIPTEVEKSSRRVVLLGQALVGAARAAFALLNVVSKVRTALGSVGSGLEALARQSRIVGTVSSGLSGLRDAFSGEGFSGAIETLKDIGATLGAMHEGTVKASSSLSDLDDGAGGSGKAAEKAKSAFAAFTDSLKDAALTAQEWGTEHAQILTGGIDSVANSWGEFVARGFSDFKGFARSVLDSFKQMLVQMIAMAAKNRILIGLGFGGVSATGLASQAVGAAVGGGGGLLGGLLGSASAGGGILAGLWSGLGGILSGGGLGASFATLGGLATGTVSGLGAIGAAIPALGIIAAGLSLIIGKTKELDHGLRVTVHGFDNLIQTFSKTQTSRLFGLIKRRRTRYRTADAEIADPISDAIADIQDSVVRAAGILGFGAEAFDDFRASIKISTKGLSDEEIVAEIQKQLATIGDGMAEMVLGEFEVLKAGETAGQALTRLANSLTAVHSVADTLGHAFDQVGIAGAALASDLVDAFGSIEAMSAATGRYFELFYGEEERRAIVVRQTAQALEALNVQMPATRDQYRALIEAQDLTAEAGQAAYAALISLAETMDFVLPAISSYTAEMQELANVALGVVDNLSASAAEMARQAATASANWKSASTALSGLVGSLINADNSTAGRQRALGYNRSAYEASVAATLGGDASAARSLPGLARSYLDSARSVAGNYVEYLTTMAGISADASSLAGFSDTEAQRHDAIASLHERQIDLLAGIRDQIGAGGLSAEELNALVSGSAGLTAQSAGAQLSAAASPSGGGLGTTQAQSAEMIAELRALKSEIASFKEEQRQLGLATVKNTGTIAKIKKKEDAIS